MSIVRGLLNGLIEGSIDIDEVEEVILKSIMDATKRGYDYGYIDGRVKRIENPRSDLLRAIRNVALDPISTSVRAELNEQLKSANLGKGIEELLSDIKAPEVSE